MASTGYVWDQEALEHDAIECFDEWSKVLDRVAEAVPGDLSASDFSLVPGGPELYEDYSTAAAQLRAYATDGATTFDGFARALLQTVQTYMRAENYAAEEIARVQKEMDSL